MGPVGAEDGQDAESGAIHRPAAAHDLVRHQLIAPPRAGVCCVSAMAWLDARRDVRGVYQDRRCRRCGFAVRVILCEIPGTTLMNSLREELARSVLRNVPE